MTTTLQQAPIVATSRGTVRGTREDGILVFRGIPYARPPVGPLRFAPPAPPTPWTGVREATAFGPPAMQAANLDAYMRSVRNAR